MKKVAPVLIFILGLLFLTQLAQAQSQRNPCWYKSGSSTSCLPTGTDNPLPVSASISVTGFAPATTGTPISATTSGVTGTLPAGTVVIATNVGTTNAAYCKLGASATTSDQYISPNGGWFAFTVGAATQLTCITSTSTTTVNTTGGSGIATGTGGGSSGGGGGGAVTMASGAVASGAYSSGSIASGAMVDIGSQADAACGTATGTCSLIALTKYNNSATNSAIPAGTNLIGDVNLRQGGTALSATNPAFNRLTDGTNAQVTDPCQAVTKINVTGSQTTGTQIIAGTSAKKTYICSIQLIAQAAEIVNIIAGTGSVCATGSSAVMGSTTAANGMSYAANGGFTQGSGVATVIAATAANADNVCITQSGSSRITYQLTYVQL